MKISSYCFGYIYDCIDLIEQKDQVTSKMLSLTKKIAGIVGLIFPGILLLSIGSLTWLVEKAIISICFKNLDSKEQAIDESPDLNNSHSTAKKISTVGSKLWIGTPMHGPISLFHGLRMHENMGSYALAKRIIKSGGLTPETFRYKKTWHEKTNTIFQHFISRLKENDPKVVNDSIKSINLYEYVQEVNDPELLNRLNKISDFSMKSLLNLEISVDRMSNTGRSITNWFTTQLHYSYGGLLSFHWELSNETVKKLEAQNAGGISFYSYGGAVVSHQELPLSLASEIIIPEYAWVEKEIKELTKLLRQNCLSHIKIRQIDFPKEDAYTLKIVDPLNCDNDSDNESNSLPNCPRAPCESFKVN